jgi:hypothetical protein
MRPFCHSHGGSFRPPHVCGTTALKSCPAMCCKPSGQELARRRPRLFLSPHSIKTRSHLGRPLMSTSLLALLQLFLGVGLPGHTSSRGSSTSLVHASINETMCQTAQLPASTPQWQALGSCIPCTAIPQWWTGIKTRWMSSLTPLVVTADLCNWS